MDALGYASWRRLVCSEARLPWWRVAVGYSSGHRDRAQNPRSVAVGANGRVSVAEAGLGGGNATTGVALGRGNTGAIREIRHVNSSSPSERVLVGGLPSAAMDEGHGPETVGPDGIYASGRADNPKLRVVIGASGIPNSLYGHAVTIPIRSRTVRDYADVGTANLAWTALHQNEPWAPAGQFPDSNPYGIGRTQGKYSVVDAGSNTLDRVKRPVRVRGRVFPEHAVE